MKNFIFDMLLFLCNPPFFVLLQCLNRRIMKKVYYIALLAIIMIVCLQGYNVHLQYLNYKLECVDKINDVLVQSVDEEYHNRAKSKKGGITKEKQHIKYKIFPAIFIAIFIAP
jgi:hypothetical protein